MKHNFIFTYKKLEEQYRIAIDIGYHFLTCSQYFSPENVVSENAIVNRVDIDFSIRKADPLRDMFDRLGIKASFFVRLHAEEYNPFSFENYRILKSIKDSGHEIGYHSEVIDESVIWDEEANACLKRDIDVLNKMLDIRIKGIASHGGMTSLNNLDFWQNKKMNDFGLDYECYIGSIEKDIFNNSLYISDSEWTRWKCYKDGVLSINDCRSFGEHLKDRPKLIYLLIHPDTYFERHIYE